MNRLLAIAIGLVVILAGLGAWLLSETRQTTTMLSEEPFGVPFELVASDGRTVTEKDLRDGKPTALFFGFTHCPEICPTTLYEMTGWLGAVDPDKTGIKGWFVSVDPARDTPAVVGDYVKAVGDRVLGMSGDPAKVEAMARGFKVYFKKVPLDEAKPDGDYTMDHTASVFLLDGAGRFVGTISYGENPEVAKEKLVNLMKRS